MPLDPRLSELAEELFGPLGTISVRKMFGGGGIYCDGVMFALIADGVIYLKADARSQADFEAEGLGPFVYQGKAKPVAMSYWRMPERLLDDPDEALAWGRNAVRAAQSARAAPRKTKPRGKG
ncbi:MAG: competence protein TfoX [Hyphomicrobium sp.]|mgnify:CR=1 FL=1|jgi:DNA transformation protein|nr:competence protein TfoX [Hyphomicrobium sp.]PPD06747.1 MAG: competence protein TfoX [Hyphomicrobium sp.]